MRDSLRIVQKYLHISDVWAVKFYQRAPHLPSSGQRWAARNVWWIAAAYVMFGAIGVTFLLFVSVLAGTAVGILLGGVLGGIVLSGIALIITIVTLIFALVSVALLALSVIPLRRFQRRGWQLLMMVLVVNVLSSFVTFILNFNFSALIVNVLSTIIIGYFVYEIRDYYLRGKQAYTTTQ